MYTIHIIRLHRDKKLSQLVRFWWWWSGFRYGSMDFFFPGYLLLLLLLCSRPSAQPSWWWGCTKCLQHQHYRLSRISSIALSMSTFCSSGPLLCCQSTFFFVSLCFSHLHCSSQWSVFACGKESIIFHPFHVHGRTIINYVSLFCRILSITVSSCFSLFLTVSFLTFCSLQWRLPVFLWANPFLSTGCCTFSFHRG